MHERNGPLSSPEAAAVITRQVPEILDLWLARVREAVPAAAGQPQPLLLDSLPQFLEHLAVLLIQPGPPGEGARTRVP